MSVSRQPLVSIVTPVYNGEPYLEQCIESVLKQTYTNWEYVILNNCSIDRSLDIARKYAAIEPRIRVHNNDRLLPQLSNFNRALSLVSPGSAYTKVVQADDWIFPECLERMVQLAEENPSVGLVSSYQLAGTRVMGDGLPFPSTVVPGREVCRLQLLDGLFFFGSPTAVLMRAKVVKKRAPFYQESALHADTDACYAILADWDFGFVHQVLTFYRTDNNGISSSIRNLNPHHLDKFISLLTHGRKFLTESEFEKFLRWFKSDYFNTLARGLFYPNGWRQFRYHQDGLKTIGYDLTLFRLSPYILSQLVDLALNPKKTAGELRKGLEKVVKHYGITIGG
jgi:glycosyltransferase involved in cell wall biosynthesis